MGNVFSQLSNEIASAVERASASIVQVYGRHRPVAGVVVGENLIVAPARAVVDDTASVRLADGNTAEGAVLGHGLAAGLAVIRVNGLAASALIAAEEPRVGDLAISVGRTWSGGVFAALTNVAVVGGPLRTGRASQIERVIRIAQPPHGALTGGALIDGAGRAFGLVTGFAIRDTTVVIPSAIAWSAAQQVAQQGGTRQGYLGISSSSVALPERQRGGRSQDYGLLVNGIVKQSPADTAGLLVGDIIVAFDGQAIEEADSLVTLLRSDRVGKPVPLTILRGVQQQEVSVTIGERPRRDSEGRRRSR